MLLGFYDRKHYLTKILKCVHGQLYTNDSLCVLCVMSYKKIWCIWLYRAEHGLVDMLQRVVQFISTTVQDMNFYFYIHDGWPSGGFTFHVPPCLKPQSHWWSSKFCSLYLAPLLKYWSVVKHTSPCYLIGHGGPLSQYPVVLKIFSSVVIWIGLEFCQG